MLLYDRVFEQVERRYHQAGHEQAERLLASMYHATVYELSSIVCLFDDWKEEKKKRIPKRPPVGNVWAEWAWKDINEDRHEAFSLWKLGALIQNVPVGSLRDSLSFSDEQKQRNPDQVYLESADEAYLVHTFRRIDESHPRTQMDGVVLAGAFMDICLMADDSSQCSIHSVLLSQSHEYLKEQANAIGVSHHIPTYDDPYCQASMPWPPFMAFALLHCKNVVTEDVLPDERLQRKLQKHKRPPRVTYKTLRVEVPRVSHAKQTYEPGDEDESARVRFHLCSGHFKNLQHERYKNKGWHWWPAHWRGSRELGAVMKSYELAPRESILG